MRFAFIFMAGLGLAQQPFVPIVTNVPGSPSQILYGTYHGVLVRSSNLGLNWLPVYITEPGFRSRLTMAFRWTRLTRTSALLRHHYRGRSLWKSTDGVADLGQIECRATHLGRRDRPSEIHPGHHAVPLHQGGQRLPRSVDQGAHWMQQGSLPGSAGREIAEGLPRVDVLRRAEHSGRLGQHGRRLYLAQRPRFRPHRDYGDVGLILRPQRLYMST